jgi:hypothetical protein
MKSSIWSLHLKSWSNLMMAHVETTFITPVVHEYDTELHHFY